MKLQANTKILKAAINRLSILPGTKGSPNSATLQLTADEFGGLKLHRATSECTVSTNLECQVDDGGYEIIDFINLQRAVQHLDGDLVITSTPQSLLVNSTSSTAKIATLAGVDFVMPDIPKPEGASFDCEAKKLLDLMGLASKAAHNDSVARPNLVGVCFRIYNGKLILFGADGRRLNVFEIEDRDEPFSFEEPDPGLFITTEALSSISKTFHDLDGTVKVIVGDRGYQCELGQTMIRLRSPEKFPPNISAFLEKIEPDASITFNRLEMLKAIQTAEVFGHGDIWGRQVQITNSKEGGIVSSDNFAGTGYTQQVAINGDNGDWLFNGRYLVDMLRCATTDEVKLDHLKQFNILSIREADRYLAVATIIPK